MTNAHVVSNTRYLTVERDGDPNKYPATVVFVAHDCDLALITVDSPDFFKNMVPLSFGGIPELGIDRFGLWLSDRRRAHVGHYRDRFANRFPALHSFVDRSASRHSDQRADQSGK